LLTGQNHSICLERATEKTKPWKRIENCSRKDMVEVNNLDKMSTSQETKSKNLPTRLSKSESRMPSEVLLMRMVRLLELLKRSNSSCKSTNLNKLTKESIMSFVSSKLKLRESKIYSKGAEKRCKKTSSSGYL